MPSKDGSFRRIQDECLCKLPLQLLPVYIRRVFSLLLVAFFVVDVSSYLAQLLDEMHENIRRIKLVPSAPPVEFLLGFLHFAKTHLISSIILLSGLSRRAMTAAGASSPCTAAPSCRQVLWRRLSASAAR